MATKNTILGTVPKSRGRYTEGDTTTKWYYDNILEYKGSSFRCISEASTGITGAPAIYNANTHTLVPNAGWEFFVDTTGALDVEERLTENEKKLSELESEVTNLVGREEQDFSDTPKIDNSYWKDDGTGKAIVGISGAGLKRVEAISLWGITSIYLSTNVGTLSVKQAYFVDKEYNIISAITSGGQLQVPTDAKFLLCNLITGKSFVCRVEGTKGLVEEIREDVEGLQSSVSTNTEKIVEIDAALSIIKDTDYSNNEVKQGEIWTGNIGNIITSTTSSYSNNARMISPINVKEGEKINVVSGINGGAMKFIYTDKNNVIVDFLPNNYPVVSTLIVPNGAKYLYINYGVNYQFSATKKSELSETIKNIDSPLEKYYAACGDSITNANHSGIETIPDNDNYCPFDGTSSNSVTYKRKNYAYFIAKKNRLKWANYGWGGSPIIGSTLGGVDLHGFAKDRYLNIADKDWNYISIFFGWNDDYLGPMVAREQWLKRKYGSNVLFPYNSSTNSVDTSLIGTGNYCTQSQYNSMLTATGEVGGVQYDNTDEYFYALFIGTIDSVDVNTWYGAWNVVLKHFILNYPYAKIMPIVAYNRGSNGEGTTEKQKEAVRLVSKKWGLTYYDFDSDSHQLFMTTNNTPIDGYANLSAYRMSKLTMDSLHPSQKGYEYMYPSIDNKLMSI